MEQIWTLCGRCEHVHLVDGECVEMVYVDDTRPNEVVQSWVAMRVLPRLSDVGWQSDGAHSLFCPACGMPLLATACPRCDVVRLQQQAASLN